MFFLNAKRDTNPITSPWSRCWISSLPRSVTPRKRRRTLANCYLVIWVGVTGIWIKIIWISNQICKYSLITSPVVFYRSFFQATKRGLQIFLRQWRRTSNRNVPNCRTLVTSFREALTSLRIFACKHAYVYITYNSESNHAYQVSMGQPKANATAGEEVQRGHGEGNSSIGSLCWFFGVRRHL